MPWHKIECVIPEVIIAAPPPPIAPPAPVPVEGIAYDAAGDIRIMLANNGILAKTNYCSDFNTPYKSGDKCCTTLAQLSGNAIAGLINLKNKCGCEIFITGGTEKVCHEFHGPDIGDSHRVDVKMDTALNSYIYNNTTFVESTSLGPRYRSLLSRTTYLNEGNHWHIEFNSPTP